MSGRSGWDWSNDPWEWAGMIKTVCGSAQDWSGVSKGVDRIGQVCLQERVGLVGRSMEVGSGQV